MVDENGRPGGLSSQATEPVPVSALRASIPDAGAWVLPFEDGGERFRVSYDLRAQYFSDQLSICANGSDDSTIYVDFEHLRWLAGTLAAAAQAIEARRAETHSGSVHESAVANGDASERSGDHA